MMSEEAAYRDAAWEWWWTHYDDVVKKMPPEYAMYIPIFSGGCSESRLKSAELFFADPKHSPPGTQGMFAKVSEGTRDCIGLRAREGEAVTRALTALAR
jgi:hypothetical protein